MAKVIGGSVGKSGANRQADVVVIKYLLNCVVVKNGGPPEELALDGLCSPKTERAILRFPKAIGVEGGKVNVGGMTFWAFSQYDPYPNQKLNLWQSGGHAPKSLKRGGIASTNSWDPSGLFQSSQDER